MFGKVSLRKASLRTTIVPNRRPKSRIRKSVAPQSSARTTTINPLQPPYVESSESVAPLSLRYRSAPYHRRPHRRPELTIQKVETIDTLIAITTTFQRYR